MKPSTILSLAAALLCSGCATSQNLPRPATAQPPADKARIVLRRQSAFIACARKMDIYDGQTFVGSLGSGGRFVWEREPGTAALTVKPTRDHLWLEAPPFTFAVEGGRTYSNMVSKAGRIMIEGSKSAPAQALPDPSTETPPPDKARIVLRRESSFYARARYMEIYDGDTFIGRLGSGERFIWEREPGTTALTVKQTWDRTWVSRPPFALAVEGGKTYSNFVNGAGIFMVEGEKRTPIVLKRRKPPAAAATSTNEAGTH